MSENSQLPLLLGQSLEEEQLTQSQPAAGLELPSSASALLQTAEQLRQKPIERRGSMDSLMSEMFADVDAPPFQAPSMGPPSPPSVVDEIQPSLQLDQTIAPSQQFEQSQQLLVEQSQSQQLVLEDEPPVVVVVSSMPEKEKGVIVAEIDPVMAQLPLNPSSLNMYGLFHSTPEPESERPMIKDDNFKLREFLWHRSLAITDKEMMVKNLAAGELIASIHSAIRILTQALQDHVMHNVTNTDLCALETVVEMLEDEHTSGNPTFFTSNCRKVFSDDVRECLAANCYSDHSRNQRVRLLCRRLDELATKAHVPFVNLSAPKSEQLIAASNIPNVILAECLREDGKISYHRGRNMPSYIPFITKQNHREDDDEGPSQKRQRL